MKKRTRRVRSAVAVVAIVGALVLAGAPALAALRMGTDNPEVLVGTHGKDQLTGLGGGDLLKGLAGNDTYYFADGWGNDTIEEKARYKVAGKQVPGGTDTLSFKGVSGGGGVTVYLIPQWGPGFSDASGPGGETVALGASVVENVVGEQVAGDVIAGGAGKNTLQPGGGSVQSDALADFGGWNDGAGGNPELPASDDTYKGFGQNSGTITVGDYGGAGDVVDLRPLASGDVYLAAVDFDLDGSGVKESLQIVFGPSSQVLILGHFSEFSTYTADYGQHGQVETVLFADGPVNAGAAAASAQALSPKQRRLAKAAPGLAEEARRDLKDAPAPGTRPKR